MKKAVLLFVFTMLAWIVFAQTGLYNVSFDKKVADVEANLKNQGFYLIQKTSASSTYLQRNNTYLVGLTLHGFYDQGEVIGWEVNYCLEDEPDLYDETIAKLTRLHGHWDYSSKTRFELSWFLENNKTLTVTYDEDDDVLTIRYAYSEYEFNK